jgi:hypothetical protein
MRHFAFAHPFLHILRLAAPSNGRQVATPILPLPSAEKYGVQLIEQHEQQASKQA